MGNLSGKDPQYFAKAKASLRDVLSEQAMKRMPYGELDFNSVAALLAPERDFVEISGATDAVKFVVTFMGRVKCASWGANTTIPNGIIEGTSLHAPLPNYQTVIFDPARHLSYWPDSFEHSKTGL